MGVPPNHQFQSVFSSYTIQLEGYPHVWKPQMKPPYSNTGVSTPGSEEALVWTSSAVQSAGEPRLQGNRIPLDILWTYFGPNCLGLSCWLWLVWCDPISDANSVQMWHDVSWCDNVTWSEYSKHQDGLRDARDSMVPSVLFVAPACFSRQLRSETDSHVVPEVKDIHWPGVQRVVFLPTLVPRLPVRVENMLSS